MKKRITALVLTGMLVFSIGGCGNGETGENDPEQNEIILTEEIPETEETPETEEIPEAEEDAFSFEEFVNLQFVFSSGAGGWRTYLTIHADGSFTGEYTDSEMGISSDSYPNGTRYICVFSGQFTQPAKINEYTYSMQIMEMNYAEEAGKEEIRDGIRYIYSDAYGLNDAQDILIYLPGAPLAELPEEFRGWVGYYDLSYTADTELPFYALNNEANQFGFTSYNVIDNLKDTISLYEEWAASVRNSLENDTLSQAEYNEKAQELYELWDSALNQTWEVLLYVLDEDTMNVVSSEELEWIAQKEQASAEAGAEYEGGSMQPMMMYLKAAEMTEERVYELLELLD